MNTFKKIRSGMFAAIITVGILGAISQPPVQAADDVGIVNWVAGGDVTNATTASSFDTTSVKIDKQLGAALVIRFTGTDSSTANVIVKLARSGDGTNFETAAPTTLSFTNAINNTTAVVGYHEISPDIIRSVHSLKLVSVQNAGAVGITNLYVGLAKKREP